MSKEQQADLFGASDTPGDPHAVYRMVTDSDEAARADGFKNAVQAKRTLQRLLTGERIGIFPSPPKASNRVPLSPGWVDEPPYAWPSVPRGWLGARGRAGHLEKADEWPNGKVILRLSVAGRMWATEQVSGDQS